MIFKPWLYQKEKIFWVAAIGFFFLNLFLFIRVMPQAYFSAYQYFPMQQIGSPLQITEATIFPLFLGGCGMMCVFILFFIFQQKQKVESTDKRRKRMFESQAYLERRRNRRETNENLNEKYEQKMAEVVMTEDTQTQRLPLLLGVDEYGEEAWVPLKEFNYHGLIAGTTGSGKTTLLEVFFDYCARAHLPALIIDGKGSSETRQSVEDYAKKHNRPLSIFSDEHDLRYNPIKYGNSVVVRDKLIGLAESESMYYSSGGEKLIQTTVQLIDQTPFLKRNLHTFSKLLNAEEALRVFHQLIPWKSLKYDDIYKRKRKMIDAYQQANEEAQEQETEKEAMKKAKAQAYTTAPRGMAGRAGARIEHQGQQPEQADVIRQMIEEMPLYRRIKFLKEELTDAQQNTFYQLFEKYEKAEGGIYQLYSKSDNLITNVDLLLNSEIGYLFDTTNSEKEELDLLAADEENAIVYVALDGLIYQKFIEILAHFLIGEMNFLASYRYKTIGREKKKNPSYVPKPMFLFCDEPTTYLSLNFLDTVNKTRGAGIHTIFSPQTLTDLKLKKPEAAEILIGNANTFMIGRLNSPEEAEYVAKLIGTYQDVDVTEVTTQEEGYSSLNRINWTGDKGTKRDVRNFKVEPDKIKELKQGEFILYRKASDEYEEPRKIYARKA
ncbi:type IV secretory system conjugative DNA transfer family protein [Listeria sp. ILCC797]|uniref:type IV secretory system conjugative DNA transfer family protein n=1 Tax=Listeria sp. ILCC797 TaxID=1918333 RepID=UPI00135660FC|nr:TraM recognition domain-containing protein [Listeria sp. ILCC797]